MLSTSFLSFENLFWSVINRASISFPSFFLKIEPNKTAISACLKDKNINIILLIALFQTPLMNSDVVDEIIKLKGKKPIIVVSAGSDFTNSLKSLLEEKGIPCYSFPEDAAKSIKKLLNYYKIT